MINNKASHIRYSMPVLAGIIFLFFFAKTCQRIDQELFLLITTDPITFLSSGEYKLSGSVSVVINDKEINTDGEIVKYSQEEIIQHGFCWSESRYPKTNENVRQLGVRDAEGSFTITISDLEANTKYFVRAYVNTKYGTEYGNEMSFTTPASLPTLTTVPPSEITETTTISGGNITDDGGAIITARGVCWSTSQNPTTSDSKTNDGFGSGSYTSTISGLSCGTTYYVRAYATNSAGTAYGNEVSFPTRQCTVNLPTVTTTSISNITETSAQGGGNITDDGGATIIARGVCWSTSQNPTISDSKTNDGAGIGSYTSSIAGLSPYTTYYVRAYAQNSIGISYGYEISFRTIQSIPFVYNIIHIGGTNRDILEKMIVSTDGGYIIGGTSASDNGGIITSKGNSDLWLTKITSNGDIQWQESYGGTSTDYLVSFIETSYDGYAILGQGFSADGDFEESNGDLEWLLIKLNSSRQIEWTQTFGGSDYDEVESFIATSDGGFLLGGRSRSSNGDLTGNKGGMDYWIVKVNSSGNLIWQKSLGSTYNDEICTVMELAGGGYLIAGTSGELDGDIINGIGLDDIWLVKFDVDGDLEWQKSLGGSDSDFPNEMIKTSDGGYVLVGRSFSNDGDMDDGNKGGMDYFILKLNNSFEKQWQKSYGGSDYDEAESIIETNDGGYLIIGISHSNDGDLTNNQGDVDYWIIKVDNRGELQWKKSLGGTNEDWPRTMLQKSDGTYVIGGYSNSNDGDFPSNYGDSDIWIHFLN